MRRLLPIAFTVAMLVAGVALAATGSKITARGAGAVKLGGTYKSLHHRKLIGRIRHGCEFGGPDTRSATLRAPLHGSVDFTLSSPRRVDDLAITGGAKTARGLGIGATISEIKAAYPQAKVDHSTDQTFLVTVVTVPKSEGGRFAFGVSTQSGKTILIGVPFIPFCD